MSKPAHRTIAFAAPLLLAALLVLPGCAAPKTGTTVSTVGSAQSMPAQQVPLGFSAATGGVMTGVTADARGFLAVGWSQSQGSRPRVWETDANGRWVGQDLGTSPGGLVAAAVGTSSVAGGSETRVAVGTAWDAAYTKATGAKVFVQRASGAWKEVAIPNPRGKIYRLEDVSEFSHLTGADPAFAAVGEAQDAKGGPGADDAPVALLSADGGATWTAHKLPVPGGVGSASVYSVTFARSGAWANKLLVAGTGSVAGAKVGFVWASGDGVKWNIVSDTAFFALGQDLQAFDVRTSGDRVLVGGVAAQTGLDSANTGTPQDVMIWSAGPDRKWSPFSTSASGQATRSSLVTAMGAIHDSAQRDAGFLIAEETYDTSGGFTNVGAPNSGNSSAALVFTADGQRFSEATKRVPGLDSAAVVAGIAQGPSGIALVGMKRDGTCGVWVVDARAIK